MTVEESHEGGCACGEVRYKTKGEPQVHAVCHCRYCQLRTGSAFGMGAYFPADKVEFNSGEQTQFNYVTVSGNKVTTSFCKKTVATSVDLYLNLFKKNLYIKFKHLNKK